MRTFGEKGQSAKLIAQFIGCGSYPPTSAMKKFILSLMLTLLLAFDACGNDFNLKATFYWPNHNCGTITASGDKINNSKLKNNLIRWVALSDDMFRIYGFKLGDIIIVESDVVKELCGEWIVKDKMGKGICQNCCL